MIPETNYMTGRDGEVVEGTVCHWTTGTAASALAHFSDPSARVSAHYIIDRDGTLIPVVDETDTAYHAGDWLTNLRTIGIEHVAGPGFPPTDAQYAASARLHHSLSQKYGFPLDAQHVRPHRAIVATQCPGTLDVDRIVREAIGEDMTADQVRAIVADYIANVYGPALEKELADRLAQNSTADVGTAVAEAVKAVGQKLVQ